MTELVLKLYKDGISKDIIEDCLIINEEEELTKAKKKAKHYGHTIKGK